MLANQQREETTNLSLVNSQIIYIIIYFYSKLLKCYIKNQNRIYKFCVNAGTNISQSLPLPSTLLSFTLNALPNQSITIIIVIKLIEYIYALYYRFTIRFLLFHVLFRLSHQTFCYFTYSSCEAKINEKIAYLKICFYLLCYLYYLKRYYQLFPNVQLLNKTINIKEQKKKRIPLILF